MGIGWQCRRDTGPWMARRWCRRDKRIVRSPCTPPRGGVIALTIGWWRQGDRWQRRSGHCTHRSTAADTPVAIHPIVTIVVIVVVAPGQSAVPGAKHRVHGLLELGLRGSDLAGVPSYLGGLQRPLRCTELFLSRLRAAVVCVVRCRSVIPTPALPAVSAAPVRVYTPVPVVFILIVCSGEFNPACPAAAAAAAAVAVVVVVGVSSFFAGVAEVAHPQVVRAQHDVHGLV